MKKILFLINNIPPDYGGGYLRVFRTATRFKQYGWLYKIATFTKEEVYNDAINGITRKDIFFLKGGILRRFFELPWKMVRHSKDYDVLYVASATKYTVLPSFVAKFHRKTIVNSVTLSMVDSPVIQPENYRLYKAPYYWYKNTQFNIADFVFVNSPLLVEECVKYGLKKESVKLINNPVDTSKYHPATPEERIGIRKSLGLPEEQFTILFVGSFNKRKGCDILPDVFTEVLKEIDKPITFVMCGQKGYPETEPILMQLQVLFEGAGSNLVIREEVRDTSPYYQASDLFLFPTTNEGMPNVVLEAMASGCMILCNTLPGISDYVLREEFLVKNNSVAEYAERVVHFYENTEAYSELLKENIYCIKSEFSIGSVDESIKLLLNKAGQ